MRAPGWSDVVVAAGAGFLSGAIAIAVVMQLPSRQDQQLIATRPSTLDRPPPVAPPPVPPASVTPRVEPDPLADLRRRQLDLPVRGAAREQLRDSFDEARASGRHEAIDILAPRNTPVLAVEGGAIAKLFTSKAGGLTIYQFDPTSTYAYYYAHLERYADGLAEGLAVRRGDVLGYVGTSGNAPKNVPHLHFAIFRLTDRKRWWQGAPIDPYEVLRSAPPQSPSR